jgi:hypothetical protein
VTVSRMKDGEEGDTWTFELRTMEIGFDRNGEKKYGAYVVIADKPTKRSETSGAKPRARKEAASIATLREAFIEAIDMGKLIRVRLDGPMIKAVDVAHVRAEFNRRYATGEIDPKKRADAQRMAFRRGMDKLGFNTCVQDNTEWM